MHWQKLGKFRKNHPSIGAGIHKQITSDGYVFSRHFSKEKYEDKVVVGLDLPKGNKIISVGNVFTNGTKVRDCYSGQNATVSDGKVKLNSNFDIVLLEKR